MRNKCRRFILALAILSSLQTASAATARSLETIVASERLRPVPDVFQRDLFISDPSLSSVTLSPDGRYIAFLRRTNDQNSLWLKDTSAKIKPRRLQGRTNARKLIWDADSASLLLVSADKVQSLAITSAGRTGLVAVLGGTSKTSFLSPHPWKDGALFVDQSAGHWRLFHARSDGTRRQMARSRQPIIDAVIDRTNRALFLKLAAKDRFALLAWQGQSGYKIVALCTAMRRCDLVGVAPDDKSAWLKGDLLGDRNALMQIDTSGVVTLLHSDPAKRSDLADIVVDRFSGIPIAALYRGGEPKRYALSGENSKALARIAQLGDGIIETSDRFWLVQERKPELKGSRWYLIDPRTAAMELVLDDHQSRPDVEQMARVVAIRFPASDGMMLHGLLSLPVGRNPAEAPLVTVVHGGPWSHDDAEYSALTQLLTNRGYVVFRPQFRGSTGFGRSYMLAAQGDFGDGRVQRDIEDGTRFLLARGIGDPTKAAIMGASFGGYATLQALSNGSNLYRVGIATTPPTDFGWNARWAAKRSETANGSGVTFGHTLKLLSLDPADQFIEARLYRQSPRARVAAMRTPLLLIAAGSDNIVPLRSVVDYAARLKVLDRPATVIVARGQRHAPSDPMALHAQIYLAEDMLNRHLNAKKTLPPSPALQRWIDIKLERW